MGNTNSELERRIAELERITEKFSQTSQPTNGRAEGQLFYDRSTDKLKAWNGNSWESVSYSLPSQTGNSGKFLTTNGTVESWSNVATGGNYASGNASVPGTTGVQYVTGLGFQPKMVVLHGTNPGGGSVGLCDGVMTATHEYCRYLHFNNAGPHAVPYLNAGAVAFYLEDPYSFNRAVKDGLNANGFSLNWTNVGLTGCSYHWEAFG